MKPLISAKRIPSLSETQLDRFIELTEKNIQSAIEEIEVLKTPFQEIERAYLEKKAAYDREKLVFDELSRNLETDKGLLQTLVFMRNGANGDIKDVRILRQTSNLAKKPKKVKKGKQIAWRASVLKVFKHANRFMKTDEIMLMLKEMDKSNSALREKNVKYKLSQALYMSQRSFEDLKGTPSDKEYFFQYKEKYGLRSWFNPDNTPKEEYMSAFFFNQQ